MTIIPGLMNEVRWTVTENDTAASGEGTKLPPVLSTPRMISLMESTCHSSIVDQLPPEESTVGILVNIRHLAATPVGLEVRIRSELIEVDGKRLKFRVEAWDPSEKIGEGEHERFIINVSRFMERVKSKAPH